MENQFGRGDQHPSVAELFAYLHSELTPQDDCGLQEHLALCGDCCVLVLELETFSSGVNPDPGPSDSAVSSGFEALWEELQDIPSFQHTSPPLRFSKPRQLHIAWTLAATLAVAALGLGLRVKSLESLARPTANVAILDLGMVTRGAPSEPRISAQVERIVFLFHLDDRQYSSYRVLLLDGTGAERLNLPDLKADQEEWSLKLELPRSSLPSGQIEFMLFGREGILEQQVGAYRVQVE